MSTLHRPSARSSRLVSGLGTWAGSTLGALTPEDRDVVRARHDLLALSRYDDPPPTRPAPVAPARRTIRFSTATTAPCPPALDCGPGAA